MSLFAANYFVSDFLIILKSYFEISSLVRFSKNFYIDNQILFLIGPYKA
jgi:hypothetical protein